MSGERVSAVARIGLRNPLLPPETCPHDTLEEQRPLTGQRLRRCNDCGELVVASDVERMHALAKLLESKKRDGDELELLRRVSEGTAQMLFEEFDRDVAARELSRAQVQELLKRWRRDYPPAARK